MCRRCDGTGQTPVSYTHLDVYKRQPHRRANRLPKPSRLDHIQQGKFSAEGDQPRRDFPVYKLAGHTSRHGAHPVPRRKFTLFHIPLFRLKTLYGKIISRFRQPPAQGLIIFRHLYTLMYQTENRMSYMQR